MNESSLLSESLVLNFILGYYFVYQLVSDNETFRTYLTGEWQFNTQKYLIFAKFIYVLLGFLLLALPIAAFYPIILIFGGKFWVKYVVLNIGLLIAPYFYFNLTFRVSKTIGLIVLSGKEEKKLVKDKTN